MQSSVFTAETPCALFSGGEKNFSLLINAYVSVIIPPHYFSWPVINVRLKASKIHKIIIPSTIKIFSDIFSEGRKNCTIKIATNTNHINKKEVSLALCKNFFMFKTHNYYQRHIEQQQTPTPYSATCYSS